MLDLAPQQRSGQPLIQPLKRHCVDQARPVIIGLGGTGGKIIRALRKSLYQEFHAGPKPDVGIGYLYVDSSSEIMAMDDPSWKTLGSSLSSSRKHRPRQRQPRSRRSPATVRKPTSAWASAATLPRKDLTH